VFAFPEFLTELLRQNYVVAFLAQLVLKKGCSDLSVYQMAYKTITTICNLRKHEHQFSGAFAAE